MHVLAINNYHYFRGGSETVYLESGKLMEANGHKMTYFSTENSKNELEGVNSYFVEDHDYGRGGGLWAMAKAACKFIYNWETAVKLEMLILEQKPDIAHLHIYYGKLSSAVIRTLRKHKIPFVVSVHDYRMICPVYLMLDGNASICSECAHGSMLSCITKKCVKQSYFFSTLVSLECFIRDVFFSPVKLADHLIFVSRFSKEIHAKFINRFPEARTSVLMNFTPERAIPISAKFGSYLLYAGRLSPEKGIGTLIRVVNKLQAELIIAGDGPIRRDLEALAGPTVRFAGICNREKLADLMGNMSYLVVPSECYENNPMVVIEALSSGKPIIGANIGGIPELVKGNGFLFSSGDMESLEKSINEALTVSMGRYRDMCLQSMEYFRHNHTPEGYFRKLLAIYKKVLNA